MWLVGAALRRLVLDSVLRSGSLWKKSSWRSVTAHGSGELLIVQGRV